jgi:hypothetical protein
MSSSPTAASSTTGSSTSSPSLAEASHGRTALVACGALAQDAAAVAARRGWPIDVHPLPPLLHNSPHRISVEVERLVDELAGRYREVVVGYADCGTYGALDELCARRGLQRLAGLHCYDLFAGAERMRRLFEDEPGTYVLTDFLVRSFARTVLQELGLDRHPELRDAYFGNYRRVVWLSQRPDDSLRRLAREAAERLGLPLTEIDTGTAGLERALADLLQAPVT